MFRDLLITAAFLMTPVVLFAALPSGQARAEVPNQAPATSAKANDDDGLQAPKPVLRGRITDEDDAPVTDAALTLVGDQFYETKTDEEGNYSFAKIDQAGDYRLRIQSERWVGITHYRSLPRLQLSPTGSVVHNLVLPRACVIRILVINEANEPVPDVQVFAASLAEERGRNAESVTTDQAGWATIGGLMPSDQEYIFGTLSSEYGFAKLVKKLDDPDVEAGEILLLSRGVEVQGVALGSDGKPAAGWRINAMPDWWQFGTSPKGAEIAEDGSFTLPRVVPGKYDVTVSVPTGEGMSRVEPGLTGVTLPTDGTPLAVILRVPSPQSMTAISGRIRTDASSPQKRSSVWTDSENREKPAGQ